MNRFAALGLLHAAADDKTVIVVCPAGQVRRALDPFRVALDAEGVTAEVRLTNGAERIVLPGAGRVLFVTPGRLRGNAADVIYLDEGVERRMSDMDRDGLNHSIRAAIATRADAIVERA